MKKLILLSFALMLSVTGMAQKTVYIPSTWVYNSSTQEYTENGNSDLQWSFNRSRQSDNCILFWQQGFGTDPTTGSITFNPDAVLAVAEQCYAMNVNTLGFSCSNMLNKYKIIILMSYTNDWVCYGGGYDFECSALWIGPSAVNPAGHSLAHEVGHSFHYMCYAEAANYNHTSSGSINTGFHLACGNGQCIWEQTAQWQANQSYPAEMFNQSYPLFGNNANYAFSHEWMRYQSYWFLYYLCQYYNDITTVAQVWKTPMTGQSNGNATDFCQAYMQLKGLNAAQFYERYFDYALRCATYDFDVAANYRDNYIGRFDYHAVQLANNKYQVAYSSAPQSTGFNVIELNVPASGTTVTTNFTALNPGCALASADPGEYNNGDGNSLVSANTSTYNSMTNDMKAYRGFRVGYVFLKSDGTRTYVNDNTVHCTGTGEVTENISATVPANTSRMFLVIAPSLTTYVKHAWDDNISNDDQWPYQFELVNATAKSITPYFEEPDFTKQIDGRDISDVTLTYNVVLPPTDGYDGATVNFSGSGLNALCTAFQMEGDDIFNNAVAYSANQANGTIMNYAVNSSMQLQTSGNTANGDFGHWFNASGTVTNWGNNSVAFIEFTTSTKTASIGQYPSANSNGTTRTIREALVYKNNSGQTATAYMIFNITFDSSVTSGYSYLADIDYDEPTTASTGSATTYRATSVQSLSITTMQGATSDAVGIIGSSLASALNSLDQQYLSNSSNFLGYYDPMSNITRGNYVYYYALNGAPTATTTQQGTTTYYQVASVTNNADFNGQYVHYFNATGGAVADVANAKLTLAYDMTNKQFTVKAADDCPVGTYTVYVGMARKVRQNNQNRIYVGYFPITITVEKYHETDSWPDITSLPADYSKYFFIFKDHTLNLYLTMRDGSHQGYRTMFYSHQNADKPEVNKNSLWTIDAYGNGYGLITNAEYRNFMMQTEYNAAWNYRTHDNGGGNNDWGRATLLYDSTESVWTIQNGTYPEAGYLGPWDNNFVDGAEVAFNKTNASIGYFDISQILRGEYVATYEDLTTVDYDHPLDITYVLENEGGERRSDVGWKNDGTNWTAQDNNALQGKVGSRYLERYNGNGLGNADLYQVIEGLPAGYYRFSAIMNGRENCYLYANNETAQAPIGIDGATVNVIVQISSGDALRVGAKAVNTTAQWIAFDEAKLEYLGTSIPTAIVGTPTSNIADGSYQQLVTGWTLNFTEATSNVQGAVFGIVNTGNKASLYKNNTKVGDYDLSVSGTEVTVDFVSLMLSLDTEYRLELPAGTVGYAGQVSNEAVSVTFHTPVVWDGTYYLYNTYTNNYISRGGEWATAAVMDDWGLALHLNTNTEGKTTLKYFDNQRYLYNDGFCYGDGTTGLNFTMSKVSGGYKFLNQNNNRYLAVLGGRAVGDAAEGDNLDGTSNIWTLESTADHVANYTRNADTQAATAAAAASLTNITTQAALDAKVASDFYAITVDEQEKKAERYQIYAAQTQEYTPAEYEKFTVENLTPGLYRLSVDAFQRAAWFDWVNNADGARGCIYLYANDAKTQLKSVMEYSSTTAFNQNWSPDGVNNYINGIPEAFDVLEEGHYNNVVYVYVPEGENSITYGITNPNRLGNDMSEGTWCCYHTFKLEYLEPYYILDETATTAPTAATNVKVKFNRTIVDKNNGGTNNAWNTICFPFALSAQQVQDIFGEGTVVKALTSATPIGDSFSLGFTEVTDGIAANTPYIMQVLEGNGQGEYLIENININPSTDLTQTVGGVQFVGNYVCPCVMENTNGEDYYILNDVFKHSTGHTKIKGFRAYFHVPSSSSVKGLCFADDGTTGILEITDDMFTAPADIYSVGGQLLRKNATDMDDLPKGIYIVNGKKVLKSK